MSQNVDITGLTKASVLAALFNATAPSGMGFFQAANGPTSMTEADAEKLVGIGSPDLGTPRREYYFDYLYGRPLKINLEGNTFDPWGFDRDNGGDGAAQKVIDRLRQTSQVNDPETTQEADDLANLRADEALALAFAQTPTTREGNTVVLGGAGAAGHLAQAVANELSRRNRQ